MRRHRPTRTIAVWFCAACLFGLSSVSVCAQDSVTTVPTPTVESVVDTITVSETATVDELMTLLNTFVPVRPTVAATSQDSQQFFKDKYFKTQEICLALMTKELSAKQTTTVITVATSINGMLSGMVPNDESVKEFKTKLTKYLADTLAKTKGTDEDSLVLHDTILVKQMELLAGSRPFTHEESKTLYILTNRCLPQLKTADMKKQALDFKLHAFLMMYRNANTPYHFAEWRQIIAEYEAVVGVTDADLRHLFIVFYQMQLVLFARHDGKVEDVKPLLNEWKTYILEKSPLNGRLIARFLPELMTIGNRSNRPDFAMEVLDDFMQSYRDSGNPVFTKALTQMEGAKRQVNLVGNEMKIYGYLLNGEKFDWKPFEGKAVLIDFWATWFGPRTTEISHMKKNWEKYHADGFEIIGLAVWDTSDNVKQYVEKEKIPWTIVDDQLGIAEGIDSIADYYGVTDISAMILIGKDGKVISTKVRGAELDRLLESIFGAP